MILGRPTNLWLGLATALVGFVSVTAVVGFNADPEAVATIGGAGTALLGAFITLVAQQPPTLNAGDAYKVTSPNTSGSVEKVANTNLAPVAPGQDAPPVAAPTK